MILYLTAYHFVLLWHNETTYERIKLIVRQLPRNPFAMEHRSVGFVQYLKHNFKSKHLIGPTPVSLMAFKVKPG